jgi:AcrR family transcriptional regulator
MMRNPEATKKLIIEKSSLLFNRKGYMGTSIQDVTKEIGMTKGSIYKNFQNKNELSIEAFKHNLQLLTHRISKYVGLEKTYTGQLLAISRFYRDDYDTMTYLGGCPLMNAAVDSDDTNTHLQKIVNEAFTTIVGFITGIIENGKRNKEIKESIISIDYAVLIFSLIEGGVLMSKTTKNRDYIHLTCDRIDKIIQEELKE